MFNTKKLGSTESYTNTYEYQLVIMTNLIIVHPDFSLYMYVHIHVDFKKLVLKNRIILYMLGHSLFSKNQMSMLIFLQSNS